MANKLFTVNARSPYTGSQTYCVLAVDRKAAIKRAFPDEKLTSEGDDRYLVEDGKGRFARVTITASSDRGCDCVIGSGSGRGVGRARPLMRRRRA